MELVLDHIGVGGRDLDRGSETFRLLEDREVFGMVVLKP